MLVTDANPFRPQVLEELAPGIRAMTGQPIDDTTQDGPGRFELISTLARPLAADVICRTIGADLDDRFRAAGLGR